MRFIFSIFAVFALGLGVLTGCQDTATPVKTEQAKTNNQVPVTPATTNANTAPKVDEHGHVDNAERITVADAKKDFDAGNAVFIDTRNEEAFKAERIKGAINISGANLEERFNQIPKGKKLIVYCSWPDEHSSAGLVTKLKEKGIENAYALLGGTAAWKNAGHPMESGEKK